MYEPAFEGKYLKDVDLAKKRGRDLEKLREVIELVLKGKPLPPKYKNHKLSR